MPNQQHVDILKRGVDIWNKWRQDHPTIEPDLRQASLQHGKYRGINLRNAKLIKAHLASADLQGADLTNADLQDADLTATKLTYATLENTHLARAQLNKADLREARLEGANLSKANLQGADLRETLLDDRTKLDGAHLGGGGTSEISLVDIRWRNANIAVIDWQGLKMLGDEQRARQEGTQNAYKIALRANRQLALVLREQGLGEEADFFAYRAQVIRRAILKLRKRTFHQYLFSWFLNLLAGYGYKPIRSLIFYVISIFAFALAYFFFDFFTHQPKNFAIELLISLNNFHSHGLFLVQEITGSLPDVLGTLEGIVGLLIEASLIATFTQRYFGR
ncbi:pentapeptide repeat-containing protein [Tengunoibacter tsumagoiensis]|uniref:Pentapeptide repeat-containing protein n=1 Tax=Tengunoibacter tsumagoiensis TaxID=2014871 RepID=A0A402A9X2_9CHLR|nr:pentapeptide repeat-containing protein [Tengunoibacter tsumagoiensis]GCE15962.1 hypothetical protein KTT_58210 [Tengunoibacter tsumagoiensis]